MSDKAKAWAARFAKVLAAAPDGIEVYWNESTTTFIVYRESEACIDECTPEDRDAREVAETEPPPFYFGVLS